MKSAFQEPVKRKVIIRNGPPMKKARIKAAAWNNLNVKDTEKAQ